MGDMEGLSEQSARLINVANIIRFRSNLLIDEVMTSPSVFDT